MTVSNLSVQSKQTLNKLYRAGLLQTYNQTEQSLDVEIGDWLSSLFDLASANVSAALSGDLVLLKEVNHSIYADASTTSNTAGGSITVLGGAGIGSGNGGAFIGEGGPAGATGVGGSATLLGGLGGSTSGAGGAAVVAGGAAHSGSDANGGNVTVRAGAKDGSGTNGTIAIGDANTSAIGIGASGITTTITGTLAATAPALTGATILGAAPAAAADQVQYGAADINGAATAAEKTVYEGGGIAERRVMSATATIKTMEWAESVDDDATIALPLPTNVGYVHVSGFDEGLDVLVKTDGTCVKQGGTTNTDVADTDTKLCVFNGTTEVTVRNRLGGARVLYISYKSA